MVRLKEVYKSQTEPFVRNRRHVFFYYFGQNVFVWNSEIEIGFK